MMDERTNDPIFQHLGKDRYAAHMVYNGLREKFPQLNERTRVVYVNHPTVYIEEPAETHISKLYEDSWEYKGQWSKGIKAWAMRLLATMFNEPHWFNLGGMDIVQQKSRVIPQAFVKTSRREIRLERYGWQMGYGVDYRGLKADVNEIICGYDPVRDTLFIYQRE